MIKFRNKIKKKYKLNLIVYTNVNGKKLNPQKDKNYTDVMKTKALKDALDKYSFDIIYGGARRDEEASRSKERIVSVREQGHLWNPKIKNLSYGIFLIMKKRHSNSKGFPSIKLDRSRYLALHISRKNWNRGSLFCKKRDCIKESESYFLIDDSRFKIQKNEKIENESIRFRTLGCYPLTAGIKSRANTLKDIISETLKQKNSERSGRLIDTDKLNSMEIKKREGYFDEYKKVVTCGSVDDGKSTLIGRIIFETQNILNDQKLKLKKLSSRFGTTGSKLDYALLLDGLQDEREQGITIDVAHRYINYKNQRLVFHDSPGHYQYIANVITAASNCDIAILLIDVKKGILEQTIRHLKILNFLNLKNIIFALNKIDLVKYIKKIFFKLKKNLEKNIQSNVKSSFVPISALNGDNVVFKSKKMKWYKRKVYLI